MAAAACYTAPGTTSEEGDSAISNRFIAPIVALSALAVLATVQIGSSLPAHAQAPPTRFYGALTLDGAPAPAGTEVVAYLGDVECGRVTTTDDGRYVIDVHSFATVEGCGIDDATVTFVVTGAIADQTGTFETGYFVNLDLTAATAAPAEPAPESAPPEESTPPEEPTPPVEE